MAKNPMQKRTQNAFLAGFLIALIIMAIIVFFILNQLKTTKDEYDKLKSSSKSVYVANTNMQSGTEVTINSFTKNSVQTGLSYEDLISSNDFEFLDENGEIVTKLDSDGNEKVKKMVLKINIPAGTIITKDMLEEVDSQTTNDLRLQEYNMIILPTLLKNGDYVDIRLQLPEGEDYIVISKKKVVYTDETSIWMNLREDEILTLGNAIIEAWTITGSKLYATKYSEPGRQEAAVQTYPVSQAVLGLINSDPNVLKSAKEGLWQRYNDQEQVTQRNDHLNKALEPNYGSMKEKVEAGLQEEIEKIKEARKKYVDSLNGQDIGVDIY